VSDSGDHFEGSLFDGSLLTAQAFGATHYRAALRPESNMVTKIFTNGA